MPEIVFDGRRITVPEGTNLVEAGKAAGVPVPVFCYHRELGAVGACRVCAVTATTDGRSKLAIACMTPAAEGMEVTTHDPDSVSLRRHVLEWLMLNHPHDCPICDEGGECQLQDLTIAAGHSLRRFSGLKRTFANQDLGAFVAHEMNRCIACYRCSRFYQDYAGGRDFGPSGSRDRVYFGRFEDGPLESPFSGNLVEVCPTGVFTDRLFRYRSRVWDLEIAPSVCPHCSVGCNLRPGARHGELQRVRVRENPEVNGPFLCDRGQFGHGWVMDPARPLRPRVPRGECDWNELLGDLAARLVEIRQVHGGGAIALVTSPRASLETHAALAALAEGPLAGAHVAHFDDPAREARALAARGLLAGAGASPLDQGAIADLDALLVVGASLVDEAPLAALAARQVARRGGRLFVLGALEHHLGDVAEAVAPCHPAATAGRLRALGRAVAAGDAARAGEDEAIADALLSARRPGLLAGSDLLDGPAFEAAAGLARALAARTPELRLGALFPGPNGFGAAALTSRPALPGVLAALEAGTLAAALLVECDPEELGPSAMRRLAGLRLLAIADHVPHALLEQASHVLPTRTVYEAHGTFVNRAGRAQGFAPVRVPGVPVTRRIEGARFPDEPRRRPPAGEAADAWLALEALRATATAGGDAAPRTLETLRETLARRPGLEGLADARPGAAGSVLAPLPLEPDDRVVGPFAAPSAGTTLYRLDRTLGSEPLSRRSAAIRTMAGPPSARLSPAGATAFAPAGRVRLAVAGHAVELPAIADASVPEGVVLVPRDVRWPVEVPQGAVVEAAAASATGREVGE